MRLTEFDLINRIKSEFAGYSRPDVIGIGDDAAVIGGKELITVDALVEGAHFISGKMSFTDIGFKSMAVNVSDIAAMGGKPLYALLSLGLTETLSPEDIDSVFKGIREAADEYGFSLIGGNMASSGVLFLSVTMLGETFNRYLPRGGAKDGDYIYISGTAGDSAIGFSVLMNNLETGVKNTDYFLERHFRPRARTGLIRYLVESYHIHSCIDVSDGLLADLGHIADESGLGFLVEAEKIPMSVDQIGININENKIYFLGFALSGGEDYELLFTTGELIDEEETFKKTGIKVAAIGRMGTVERNVTYYGRALDYKNLKKGFVHF